MANAVKMLPFPVTSDSAELTLLWGRDIHGPQFGYRIPLMTDQKRLSKGVIYVGKHLNVSDFFFLTKIYSLGEVLTLFVKMIR